MMFSSIIFILYFFPLVLVLYYGLKNRPLQNIFLFLASLVFYAWSGPKCALFILLSIAVNFILGLLIANRRQRAKTYLYIGIGFNVVFLGYFKYTYFILNNIDPTGHLSAIIPSIALPLGVSFYTLQAISYLIEVYRKNARAQKNPFNLGLYLSFFPIVTAGPIMRYDQFEPQLFQRKESIRAFSVGLCRFVTGLGKKILIANSMAVVADRIFAFSAAGPVTVSLAWLGAVSFALQIYFDFAAYSDMAIGLGMMLGFNVPENFKYPYIAKTVTEFWRRWHMTLTEWFKHYVYIPLGGSRVKSTDGLIRNLLIVWVLVGIWHGADWIFILWGLLNFTCIAVEKLFKVPEKEVAPWQYFYMFLVIIFSWTLFRSESLLAAGRYFGSMFGAGGFWSDYTWMFLRENWAFYALAVVFMAPITRKLNTYVVNGLYEEYGKAVIFFYPLFVIAVFLISLSYLIKASYI